MNIDKLKTWWRELRWSTRYKWGIRHIRDFYWGIQHRFNPEHQYNKIHTGLPPGYYDLDTRILYAVMNEFKDFYGADVKHSFKQRNVDWDTDPEIVKALASDDEYESVWFKDMYSTKKELDEIYDWWVHRYLKYQDEDAAFWKKQAEKATAEDKKLFFGRVNIEELARLELEEELEEEANEMLARLMKVRRVLWN